MVMDVVEGKMASGTNIQQWTSSHGKWQQWILKRFSTSNYYYIHSAYNQNFALKVNSATNGGNISLELYSKSDSSLLFKFSKNPDGTYFIFTRLSKEKCLVEVENAGLGSGDNVQQYEYTNHLCQKWNLNQYTLDVNLTMSNPIVKTQVFKDNECVHTVVFMK
jgi:pectin lyase